MKVRNFVGFSLKMLRCRVGEAGSSLTYACAHEIYTDFSMHEKNKTEKTWKHNYTLHVCEILAQRWDRRVSLSSAVSVGRRSLLHVHPPDDTYI